jgi:glycosyltransferase involved in cell wall biosynthesis
VGNCAISFVLPGDNYSGGVRATATMANVLLARGHRVRVLHSASRLFRMRQALCVGCRAMLGNNDGQDGGWLRTFTGPIEQFSDLAGVRFLRGEVVVGVGSLTLACLNRLHAPHVIKVKYNHGLPLPMTARFRAGMAGPGHIITVSSTLVPELEDLSGGQVRAVVPNGIDARQYAPLAEVPRNAIGTIYSSHPTKAPEDLLALAAGARNHWPEVPMLVFGTERRPANLEASCLYERCPSVERARELYSRSLIWLVGSRTEGFSLPILEAMACGAAVISTDTHGGRELIMDGVNGLLVERGDIGGFMRRIEALLNDAALRGRLVEGGFATVSRFNWHAAADSMEAFLRTVM